MPDFFRPRGGGSIGFVPRDFMGLSGLARGIGAVGDQLVARDERDRQQAIQEAELANQVGDRQTAFARLLEAGLLPEGSEFTERPDEIVDRITSHALTQLESGGEMSEEQTRIASRALFGDPLLEQKAEGMDIQNLLGNLQIRQTQEMLDQSTALDALANETLVGTPYAGIGFRGYELASAEFTRQDQIYQESIREIETRILGLQARQLQGDVLAAEELRPLQAEQLRLQNEYNETRNRFQPLLAQNELANGAAQRERLRAQAEAEALEAKLNPAVIAQVRDLAPLAVGADFTVQDLIAGASGTLQDPEKLLRYNAAVEARRTGAVAEIRQTLIEAQNQGMDAAIDQLLSLKEVGESFGTDDDFERQGLYSAYIQRLYGDMFGINRTITNRRGRFTGNVREGEFRLNPEDEITPPQLQLFDGLPDLVGVVDEALEGIDRSASGGTFSGEMLDHEISNQLSRVAESMNIEPTDQAASIALLEELQTIDYSNPDMDSTEKNYWRQVTSQLENSLPENMRAVDADRRQVENEVEDVEGLSIPKNASVDELQTQLNVVNDRIQDLDFQIRGTGPQEFQPARQELLQARKQVKALRSMIRSRGGRPVADRGGVDIEGNPAPGDTSFVPGDVRISRFIGTFTTPQGDTIFPRRFNPR